MKAAEVGNKNCCMFLLRQGSNPFFHDIRGQHRTAAWYARVNHPESDIADIIDKYIEEITQQQVDPDQSVTAGGDDTGMQD